MRYLNAILIALCLVCSCTKAEDNYIKIERKHLTKEFGCEGGSAMFLVDANVNFNYECDVDWIDAKINGPSIAYEVAPLRDCPDRSAVLRVVGAGVNDIEVNITQTAITVNNAPESFVITNHSPAMAIDITSGVELVFDLPEWVESVDADFEYGQKTYTFTALPINDGSAERSGEFAVRAKDEKVGFELTIPIEQSSTTNEHMKKMDELWQTDPLAPMSATSDDPRYALLTLMQKNSELFNRDPFQEYLKLGPADAFKVEQDNAIMSCYRYAYDVVLSEIKTTKVEEGSAVIWMLYNMGFIIKTPSVCLGVDINHYYAEQFAPYLDLLLVSHADSDHRDDDLMTAMCDMGKPVLSNFWQKSSTYMSTTPREYSVNGLKIYTSITDHDAEKRNYTTCHFVEFGENAGNFTFMHVGDSNFQTAQYKEMTGRTPNLLVLRYGAAAEKNILGTGSGQVQPDYIFLSHLIELRHYVEKSPGRASILNAWKNNQNNLSGKAHLPFWGERFIWKDGDLKTWNR